MNKEDDFSELMDLFDNPPEPKHKKRNPAFCNICGLQSDELEPRTVGKTTLYLCYFCRCAISAGEYWIPQ